MKKFFKSYFPIFISLILFLICGVLISSMFNPNIMATYDVFSITMLVLTILCVILVYTEMIYFMIKAGKNNKIKNNILWCFLLYFFNVFIIPYFNWKYVVNEKNIKVKMVIFGVLSVVVLGLSIYLPTKFYSKEQIYVVEDKIQFKFSSNYQKREVGEYDFYVSDFFNNINVGAYIYEEEDNVSEEDILKYRDNWLKESRDDVVLLDEEVHELDDKRIISNVYVGDYEEDSFIYKISTISFDKSEIIINVLEVCFLNDYDEVKGELSQILFDVEYIGTN